MQRVIAHTPREGFVDIENSYACKYDDTKQLAVCGAAWHASVSEYRDDQRQRRGETCWKHKSGEQTLASNMQSIRMRAL